MAGPPPALIPGLQGWERLGAGGFGVVYRAVDSAHSRTVAVKLLSAPAMDDHTLRAFNRERTAMGRLSGHPNIVTVYQSGLTEDERPYIVMDHMAGGSLADRIAHDGPLPWAEAAGIGVRIAAALQAAHNVGVLHRDIKPANVLLTGWGEAKLADFGIATLATATGSVTGGNSASIAHAAPEVLDGKRPTSAADVYSLGSTLHMLVTGWAPFHRAEDESIIPMIARVARDDPPDFRDGVMPDGFPEAVHKAMSKDPGDRFPTAEAFGRRLQQLLRDAGQAVPDMVTDMAPTTRPPISAGGPTLPAAALPDVPHPSKVPSPSSPRQWAAVSLTLLVVVLAVGGWLASRNGTGEDTAVAGVAASPVDADPEVDVDPGVGADQGTVVYRDITPDGPRLALVSADGGEPVVLSDLRDVDRPALSPDGSQIAVVSDDALRVVDPTSGAMTVVVEGEVRDPAWSPDGRQLAYAADVEGQLDLFAVEVAGGEPRRITDTPEDEGSPAWTSDGEGLLYDSDVAGSFDIWQIGLEGGDARQVTSSSADDETPVAHPTDGTIVFVQRGAESTDLVQMALDGSGEPVQLTSDLANVNSPSFSPDGTRVVFSSNSRGDFDLWVLTPSTGALATLLVDTGNQTDPDWGS